MMPTLIFLYLGQSFWAAIWLEKLHITHYRHICDYCFGRDPTNPNLQLLVRKFIPSTNHLICHWTVSPILFWPTHTYSTYVFVLLMFIVHSRLKALTKKKIVPFRFGAILPLFVNYFFEIPSLSNLNMFSISSKSMFYLIGGQVALSSTNHSIVFVASLLAGLWMRNNLFMVKRWIRVPILLASLTDRYGHWTHILYICYFWWIWTENHDLYVQIVWLDG